MQKKKGISLIVLIIIIIVMILLAGVVILTLSNAGIIGQASETVKDTDLVTVKYLADMAWGDAYAVGVRKLEDLEDAVFEKLEKSKVDTSRYVIEVSLNGVDVELKGAWVQDGLTVTDGKIVVRVGDKIKYTATGTNYTGEWQVLGANDRGELLIISLINVATYRLGYETTITDSAQKLKECQNAWLNGAKELNKICEPYGKGKGATSARSLMVEDVIKVTNYDITQYNKDQITEYGNEITYSYNGTTQPSYKYTKKDGTAVTGKLAYVHNNGFNYYNGKEFVVADLSNKTGEITTLKCNYLYFHVSNTLFETGTSLGNIYWLASPYAQTTPDCIYFGMLSVSANWLHGFCLWTPRGDANTVSRGVRAVVSLSSNIKLTGSSETGWSY